MPHGKHMFQTASYMSMATMCAYQSSKYTLSYYKWVLCCCAKCPQIDRLSKESDQYNSNVIPTISFFVYKHIAHCTIHDRYLFRKINPFNCVSFSIDSIENSKVYTRKELVVMESSIMEFRRDLYIPEIQKL